MSSLSITITSDPVCPYCYIGLNKFNRALGLYRKTVPGASAAPVNISWHAYQLDPAAPRRVSQSWAEKTASRWGEDRVPQIFNRLRDVGLREGILFNFDSKIGNTTEAHRLVLLARKLDPTGEKQLEHRVSEETMQMYFVEGGDITKTEDLVKAAARAGLDADEARTWLEGDEGLEEVQREAKEAVDLGVKGVPRFVINDKHVIDGADDVGVFLEKLALAKEEATGECEEK